MKYDRMMWIATAASRESTNWITAQMRWTEFAERLKTPVRGVEPLAQYLKMGKAQQDELKDIGGYVFGALKLPRRKAEYVIAREGITLDLDSIPAGETETILANVDYLNCAAVVHSTRKHSSDKPRLRVIIPFDSEIKPDHYEPIARYFASKLGIENCDPSTY